MRDNKLLHQGSGWSNCRHRPLLTHLLRVILCTGICIFMYV